MLQIKLKCHFQLCNTGVMYHLFFYDEDWGDCQKVSEDGLALYQDLSSELLDWMITSLL